MPTIDVFKIIENQKLSRFLIGLMAISWIITFFDGLDANLISFAASYFRRDYHLTTAQTGNIFAVHQVGTLMGGFLFAYIADRIGRRPAVILATAGFGAVTMAFYGANSYSSLYTLRLIDGFPLGGMLPLAWALNIEYAPKRYRATIVTVIMMGYSLGTAVGGPFANWLIPKFGWKSLFISGGAAALAGAAVLFAMLPESVRFLVSEGKDSERIASILRRVAPGTSISPGANFVVSDEEGRSKDFRPAHLFQGDLRVITPFIWIAYIASSFAVFFIVNWTPLVFEALHYTRAEANSAAAINSLLGAISGLLLMRFTDRRGAIAITPMPLITCALLLIAGLVGLSHDTFKLVAAAIGGFLIGGHFGMHSICGIFYPSAYRANGAGWATSVAKIGSIAGPMVGGWVLATSIPVRNIYAVLAVCPAIYALCIYFVGRAHSSILGRERFAAPPKFQEMEHNHPISEGGLKSSQRTRLLDIVSHRDRQAGAIDVPKILLDPMQPAVRGRRTEEALKVVSLTSPLARKFAHESRVRSIPNSAKSSGTFRKLPECHHHPFVRRGAPHVNSLFLQDSSSAAILTERAFGKPMRKGPSRDRDGPPDNKRGGIDLGRRIIFLWQSTYCREIFTSFSRNTLLSYSNLRASL